MEGGDVGARAPLAAGDGVEVVALGGSEWSWSLRGFPWMLVLGLLSWGSFLVGLGYGIASAVLVTLTPRITSFSQDNPAISAPNKGDTIPAFVVVLVPFVLWFILAFLFEFFILRKHNISLPVAVFSAANLLMRIVETYLGTVVLQQLSAVLLGQLRPEFLAVCMPNAQNECTNENMSEVNDARKSYFSGHVSTSMCISTFLALYLMYVWCVRYERCPPGFSTFVGKKRSFGAALLRQLADALVFFLASSTIILSVVVGVSRVIDGKHFTADANAGLIVGFSFTILFFPRYVILNERGIRALQSSLHGIDHRGGAHFDLALDSTAAHEETLPV
mmetsp:Transcript_13789/g.37011  ORF Transcript_13789/g.37011 Transcript_13789/m.37011 type:complete len:333 (+) Transcript_13789:70-1068(+)|eukprot:CAMPEP_0185839730 /NCGR_PEP_ID=MMETSP1353-20130828/15073_1 /TAXON_ID=1077150 /ORGANISM="Erythrolobus australicus, Strain CCMP3124" /LENGTH=332 /DNA_ID=CAMNT_0028538945 /DNA_START=63 /DNA_END=1061 /DNA_ORIENTATION=-